jgi:putative lipoic acid-binding regulatory protein
MFFERRPAYNPPQDFHYSRDIPVNPSPSLELLEATHEFPGRFMFKAIGPNREEFIADIVATVRGALAHEFDPPFELNPSSGGRHVSVTITPTVETATQVLAIFEQLRTVNGLVMLL